LNSRFDGSVISDFLLFFPQKLFNFPENKSNSGTANRPPLSTLTSTSIMPHTPIIYLAFADNADVPLDMLKEEYGKVYDALIPLADKDYIKLRGKPNEKKADLFRYLSEYKDRLVVFHFAGHAKGESLILEDGSGHAAGLAGLLGGQKQLRLVFLNGCSTWRQVDAYFQNGARALLATNIPVKDGQAAFFAEWFYGSLAKGHTVKEAYEFAAGALKTEYEEYKDVIVSPQEYRDEAPEFTEQELPNPWQLFVRPGEEEALDWKIEKRRWNEDDGFPWKLTPVPAIDPEREVVGREEDMKRLRQTIAGSARVVVMNGVGGIGKTTLAKVYAHRFGEEYDHIAWIEQLDNFPNNAVATPGLIENLGLAVGEKEDEWAIFKEIMRALGNLPGKNLLVIDNADRQIAAPEIDGLLPGPPRWHVLATSRQRLDPFREMHLDELDPDAARELFRMHCAEEVEESVLGELLEYIGYHTLAIELIARTIEASMGDLTPAAMLEKLKTRRLSDEEVRYMVGSGHSKRETELFGHLTAAFDLSQLEEVERAMLKYFLALPPFDVPLDTLRDLLEIPKESRKDFNETLRSLGRKGWLDLNYQAKTARMHRLVGEVLRYSLAPKEEDLEGLIDAVASRLSIDQARDNPIDKFPWIPYGEGILNCLPEADGEKISILKNNLATVYQDLGRYDRAAQLLEAALSSDEKNFGPDHPTVAVSQSNLATVYRDLGRYERAAQLLEAALSSDEKNFGPDHPTVAVSQSNLATVYLEKGDYQGARELFEKALRVFQDRLGEDHPKTKAVERWMEGMDEEE
jgi:tetratricopeptide (TPR) repeat protein